MHVASVVELEVWINNLKYDLMIRITTFKLWFKTAKN